MGHGQGGPGVSFAKCPTVRPCLIEDPCPVRSEVLLKTRVIRAETGCWDRRVPFEGTLRNSGHTCVEPLKKTTLVGTFLHARARL